LVGICNVARIPRGMFCCATLMLPRRTALIAAGAALAFLLVHAAISGCDHDEVQHLHAAWLVSQGEAPFRDFLEQHHPTGFYLLAPVTRALAGSPRALVFAIRALNLLVLALALAAFLRLARPLLRDRDALWPPLLLLGSFFFARNSMEVRPDTWMSALCVLALWQWSAYLREGRLRSAALAGFCAGLAVVFLQKAVAFAGLMALGTAAIAVARPERLQRILRGGALAAAAALLPIGALFALVQRAGLWSDFFFWNYTFNRFYYLATQFDGPSALAIVGVSLAENPLLWLGGLWGLSIALRRFRALPDQPELALSIAVAVGLLTSLFQSRWPFSHNLLLVQPALALLAVHALEELRAPRWRTAAGIAMLVLIAKVGVLSFAYDEGHGNLRVQERILAATGPVDRVAAPPPYNPIFRRDSFFFWYVPVNNAHAYLETCRRWRCPGGKVDHDLQAWRTDPPALVYLPADEPTWAPVGFDAHRAEYRETDVPGLWRRTGGMDSRAERP
jgi:4-amino-4-deoxy-L-arabinose transferase-like glycosyltransferase